MAESFTFDEIAAALRVDGANLVWRVSRGKASAGSRAGRMDRQGYIVLQFKGRDLQAHRVVWLQTRGAWPEAMIDHINGNRADNRPENLRSATNAENQRNRISSSATGFKGVTPHKRTGKFQAQCAGEYLGLFDTPEEAARVYDTNAIQRFGEFARPNFRSPS